MVKVPTEFVRMFMSEGCAACSSKLVLVRQLDQSKQLHQCLLAKIELD